MKIERDLCLTALERLKKRPAVAILGARQVGKTTLPDLIVKKAGKPYVRLDLEDPDDRSILANAKDYLVAHAHELVVIDEVQRMPELFPLLRTLIDRDKRPGRFLLLGSSSTSLLQQASESLTGRIAYLDLFPFSLNEVGRKAQETLWLRGGFPDAFLAENDAEAFDVLKDMLRSITERDLPDLGLAAKPGQTLQLLQMLAHTQGSPLNMAMLAKSMGVSNGTIKDRMHYLEGSYLVNLLPSYHVNLRKRLTKAPKVFLMDTGLMHAWLSVKSAEGLFGHPLRGASWEGFVIQQIRASLPSNTGMHYYRTQDGSELDLILTRGGNPVAAIEIRTTNSPALTKGNYLAFEAVNGSAPKGHQVRNLIITPSAKDHPYGRDIDVRSLASGLKELGELLR